MTNTITETIDDDTPKVTTITKANITHTILNEELPKDLKDFADLSALNSFSQLEYLKEYLGDNFTLDGLEYKLNLAYNDAMENNAIHLYQYDDFCRLEFDTKLTSMSGKKLYASFSKNKTASGQAWICRRIRDWDFFHEIVDKYNLNITNSKCIIECDDFCSVDLSSFDNVVHHVVEKFFQKIEDNNILEYNDGFETFVEYSLDIVDENGGVMYAKFKVTSKSSTAKKPWFFEKFVAHNGNVFESINKSVDEANVARKSISEKIDNEIYAESKDAEYNNVDVLYNSIINDNITINDVAVDNLEIQKLNLTIPEMKEKLRLQPFSTIKIATPKIFETYGKLSAFAEIDIVKLQKILPIIKKSKIRDPYELIEYISKTYEKCYRNNSIAYYENESGEITAELKSNLQTPSGEHYYFCFKENRYFNADYYNPDSLSGGQRQWYFSYVRLGGKIHEFVRSYLDKPILKMFKATCGDAFNSWNIAKLIESVNDSFIKALSNPESILCYWSDKVQMVEIPLDLFIEDRQIYTQYTRSLQIVKQKVIDKLDFKSFCIRSSDPIPEIYYEVEVLKQARAKSLVNRTIKNDISAQPLPESNKPQITSSSSQSLNQPIINPMETPATLKDFCPNIIPRNWQILADAAEPENWSMKGYDSLKALRLYLNDRFYRLSKEKKVLISTNTGVGTFAAIHTGLYTANFHAPIYGFFRQIVIGRDELGQDIISWWLIGFVNHWDGGEQYDLFTKYFPTKPENVDFLRENGEYVPIHHYVFDPTKDIDLDQVHVIQERGYRLPLDFIKELCKRAGEKDMISALEEVEAEKDNVFQKELWNKFYDLLTENDELEKKIASQVKYMIQDALHSNTHHAIPIYYSLKNTIEWILPLHVSNSDTKDITGLVIERKWGDDKYKGTTLMDIDNNYAKARVVKKPCDAWFPSRVMEMDETDIDDEIARNYDEQYESDEYYENEYEDEELNEYDASEYEDEELSEYSVSESEEEELSESETNESEMEGES